MRTHESRHRVSSPGTWLKGLALVSLTLAMLQFAAASAQTIRDPLVVAVADCPPFVITEGGQLTGLGIFLWDEIGAQLGLTYEFREFSLNEMLAAIAEPRAGRIVDVGISCLSITAEREKVIDFSHSFFETHIGIAVRQQGYMGVIAGFFMNPLIYKGFAIILISAAALGAIFYWLENKINPKLYTLKLGRGRLLEAFLVGLQFATRGPINFYEFKTLTGRTLAALLAAGSTLLIAGITAVLASAFTLDTLRSQVTGLQDLKNVKVGTLANSTSSDFLRENGIVHREREDLDALLAELDSGQLDAVVLDEAYLRYAIKKGRENGKYDLLTVLPEEYENQNYGFALDRNSDLQEPVNQALLQVRKSARWHDLLNEYLGAP